MKNWKILTTINKKNEVKQYRNSLREKEIHSVKRLSDGMIFTLGDIVNFKNFHTSGKIVITKFWEGWKQMRIDCGNLGLHIDMLNLIVVNKENENG